jgi:general secretion pathway protein E
MSMTVLSDKEVPNADFRSVCRNAHDHYFADDFGAFLIRQNIIETSVLDRTKSAASATGERFDQVLTKLGLVTEADLTLSLSKYLTVGMVSPNEIPTEPLLTDLIDTDFVRLNRIIPLYSKENELILGIVDPFNDEPIRAIEFLTDCGAVLRLFTPAEFDRAYQMLYVPSDFSTNANNFHTGNEVNELDVQRLRDIASEAPIIRLVNQIITQAVETRASDIHLEPSIDAVEIRYRIDGVLRTVQSVASGMRAAVTSRIKIMAKLDIAERRMPQDGRIKMAVRGADIDFRVSTIPTSFGESVVMRILDRSRVELDFVKLGFAPNHIAAFKELMDQPNGIILITGPTGSGKTTTLYTVLELLNNGERKIFTVEDPIEYQLTAVNQVQVQSAIGLTFPHALRSILRQDPDIIMIGEIRDLETARIAIQASLTGHLVLSTLHTNNAASTITRLIDMGIENYLLASTVKGIIAQRLVRYLCPTCSIPHERAAYWSREFESNVKEISRLGPPNIRKPRGCSECGETGYRGRTTIAEILPVNTKIHNLILSAASDVDINRVAREQSVMSLYESGAHKVWRGETTIEELLRATRL